MNKLYPNAAAALDGLLKDGLLLAVGGFQHRDVLALAARDGAGDVRQLLGDVVGFGADRPSDAQFRIEVLRRVEQREDRRIVDWLDGMEATRAIRRLFAASSNDMRPALPIIAVTANAFPEDRQRYLAAGMDDYVAKPIRPKDLQAILDTWLHKRNQAAAS